MSKKRKHFYIGRSLFLWLLTTGFILIGGGLAGGLANVWATPQMFFFALFEVFQGTFTPWTLSIVLTLSLATALLVIYSAVALCFNNKKSSDKTAVAVPKFTNENLSVLQQISSNPLITPVSSPSTAKNNNIIDPKELTPIDSFSLGDNTPPLSTISSNISSANPLLPPSSPSIFPAATYSSPLQNNSLGLSTANTAPLSPTNLNTVSKKLFVTPTKTTSPEVQTSTPTSPSTTPSLKAKKKGEKENNNLNLLEKTPIHSPAESTLSGQKTPIDQFSLSPSNA